MTATLQCQQYLLEAFFDRYPNERVRELTFEMLEILPERCGNLSGDPGGWAGGLYHAIAKNTALHCRTLLNAELAGSFDVSMSVIRKRAAQIWDAIEQDVMEFLVRRGGLTWRDQANAICVFAFRFGLLDTIHTSVDSDGRPRITDPEMKQLMSESSRKLAEILEMRDSKPAEYQKFLHEFSPFCGLWER